MKQKCRTKNKEGRQWEKTSVDLLWPPFSPSIAPSPLVRPHVAQVVKKDTKDTKRREKSDL
jgi:hypothetical protein